MDSAQVENELDSDSEWEYEYHPTETETFYVTLDTSSAANDALSAFKGGKPKKAEGEGASGNTAQSPDRESGSQASTAALNFKPETPAVQILDLASRNPLVSHDGYLYSCAWGSTIGTDLIFARPDVELPFEPLHRDAGFQLVTTSTIRLVGKSAKLVPKNPTASEASGSNSYKAASDQSSFEAIASDPGRLNIPVPASAGDERHKQAAFLERIIAAKRARGDADEVFVARNKTYADFERQESIRPRRGKGRLPSRGRGSDTIRARHRTIDLINTTNPEQAEAAQSAERLVTENEQTAEQRPSPVTAEDDNQPALSEREVIEDIEMGEA